MEPLKRDVADDHYMGDLNIPIFRRGKTRGLETKLLLKDLFSIDKTSAKVCQRMPLCVNQNLMFLINLDKFRSEKDILCDGNGIWSQTSTKNKYYTRMENEFILSSEQSYGDSAFIRTKRLSFKHSTSHDFHRVILFVWLHNGVDETLHELGFIQYFFDQDEHLVNAPPHGNSKTSIPFHRTCESTKTAIRNQITGQNFISPKAAVHQILKERGGMENIKMPGEHARDRKQISNFNYNTDKCSVPVLELMELCKSQSYTPESVFVREVTPSPELSVLLASKQQLLDVQRFCTNPKEFCILGVDATFNVGQYYLTLTTYRNLMLSNKTGAHPVFLGPALIHQRRLFDSYFQLPSGMLKYCPDLKNLLAYGSDGEKNITDSFDTCFSGAKHLLCDLHMKDNIKQKLLNLNISTNESKIFMDDIFGIQIGQSKRAGLVDCTSEDAFDKMLESLKDDWCNRHPNGEEFFQYFITYKSDLIKQSMTADVRAMTGLGFPPQLYNQNANECMNSVIKRELKWKRLNPMEVVTHIEHIVRRQFDEAKLAMIGRGEYSVIEKYAEYQVPEVRYYQMTKSQKEKNERRFFNAEVKSDDELQDKDTSSQTDVETCLSVKLENSGITSVPYLTLKGIFLKAVTLKQTPEAIVKAPIPNSETYYVASCSNSKVPHMVIVKSNGALECDNNCMHFCTFKLCSHVLAVADKNGCLQSFLNIYNKKKVSPNISALANANLPNNRGKKPTKATQKRKGGDPNKRRPEVLEVTRETEVCVVKTVKEKPNLPSPESGTYSIALLAHCHVNTTTCYGCKGLFKKDGFPKSPGDLIIVTKGQRQYTQNGETKLSTKSTNIYFHFNEKCVKNYDSCFIPCLARVADDVKPHLNNVHKQVLEAASIFI